MRYLPFKICFCQTHSREVCQLFEVNRQLENFNFEMDLGSCLSLNESLRYAYAIIHLLADVFLGSKCLSSLIFSRRRWWETNLKTYLGERCAQVASRRFYQSFCSVSKREALINKRPPSMLRQKLTSTSIMFPFLYFSCFTSFSPVHISRWRKHSRQSNRWCGW